MNKPAKYPFALRPLGSTILSAALLCMMMVSSLYPIKAAAQNELSEPSLMTEVHNTLNQVIVRWESDPEANLQGYTLYRAPAGTDQWEKVVTCEYYEEKTLYAYRDLNVDKHNKITYRLEAVGADGSKIQYTPVSAQLTPYEQRLSYRVDMEKQTISFFGGFLQSDSRVTLMDLEGGRFEFSTAFVDDRLVMDAIELPNGKYTYTVATGNNRRSGNVQFDRQMLEEMPGAFAFSPSKDE
ncbi:MAG: hypothetical protein AAGA85_09245 [Bacteroidota bacterium]